MRGAKPGNYLKCPLKCVSGNFVDWGFSTNFQEQAFFYRYWQRLIPCFGFTKLGKISEIFHTGIFVVFLGGLQKRQKSGQKENGKATFLGSTKVQRWPQDPLVILLLRSTFFRVVEVWKSMKNWRYCRYEPFLIPYLVPHFSCLQKCGEVWQSRDKVSIIPLLRTPCNSLVRSILLRALKVPWNIVWPT